MDNNLKCTDSSLTLLNCYRRNYNESKAFVTAINRGQMEANRGYWLAQCKKDKKALKAYAERLKSNFNTRK